MDKKDIIIGEVRDSEKIKEIINNMPVNKEETREKLVEHAIKQLFTEEEIKGKTTEELEIMLSAKLAAKATVAGIKGFLHINKELEKNDQNGGK